MTDTEAAEKALSLIAQKEWGGGGHEEGPLDYYDDGERSTGFCLACDAPESRGHHPGCLVAAILNTPTVTDKQAERAEQKRLLAVAAEERKQREAREAEWQAHLATLTPEQRANAIERARAISESMERAFLPGCNPSPLTQLLQASKTMQASKTTKGIRDFVSTNVEEV